MGKRILTYGDGGSVEQIQEVPEALADMLDNASSLPVNFNIPMRQTFEIADGADASIAGSWVAPFDCKVVFAGGYKVGAGAGGNALELNTSAPAAIITWDASVSDELPTPASIDDAIVTISAGTSLTLKRTKAGGSVAANVFFDVIPA